MVDQGCGLREISQVRRDVDDRRAIPAVRQKRREFRLRGLPLLQTIKFAVEILQRAEFLEWDVPAAVDVPKLGLVRSKTPGPNQPNSGLGPFAQPAKPEPAEVGVAAKVRNS